MEPSKETYRPSPVAQPDRAGSVPSESQSRGPEVYRRVSSNERVRSSWSSQVKGVQILPSKKVEQGGKSFYRLFLNLEVAPNLSILSRRTGTVAAFEVEIEEKELAPLSRLTGREVLVHYLLWQSDLDVDGLQRENDDLREHIEALTKKLRLVQSQLQFMAESQVRDERL